MESQEFKPSLFNGGMVILHQKEANTPFLLRDEFGNSVCAVFTSQSVADEFIEREGLRDRGAATGVPVSSGVSACLKYAAAGAVFFTLDPPSMATFTAMELSELLSHLMCVAYDEGKAHGEEEALEEEYEEAGEIEPRVIRLVVAMGNIPGVQTSASCGGHENPQDSQCALDAFWVGFYVDANAMGWTALELLAWAIGVDLDLELTIWTEAEDEPERDSLRFGVRGKNGADPDALAERINSALDGSPQDAT